MLKTWCQKISKLILDSANRFVRTWNRRGMFCLRKSWRQKEATQSERWTALPSTRFTISKDFGFRIRWPSWTPIPAAAIWTRTGRSRNWSASLLVLRTVSSSWIWLDLLRSPFCLTNWICRRTSTSLCSPFSANPSRITSTCSSLSLTVRCRPYWNSSSQKTECLFRRTAGLASQFTTNSTKPTILDFSGRIVNQATAVPAAPSKIRLRVTNPTPCHRFATALRCL